MPGLVSTVIKLGQYLSHAFVNGFSFKPDIQDVHFVVVSLQVPHLQSQDIHVQLVALGMEVSAGHIVSHLPRVKYVYGWHEVQVVALPWHVLHPYVHTLHCPVVEF